jgi:hypothetical protein
MNKKNQHINNLFVDFINHIHSIKNKEMLTSCLKKELKGIKIKQFIYKTNSTEISQLILKFDAWISISIEDDHVSLNILDDLIDSKSDNIRYEYVDTEIDLSTFIFKRLKNFFDN